MKTLLLASALLLAVTTSGWAQDAATSTPTLKTRAYTASEWALLAGHALDTASTQRCIGAGVCHESNPWLARYEDPLAFTAAKFGVGFLQLWATRTIARRGHPRIAATMNIVSAGVLTGVAIRNVRIVK